MQLIASDGLQKAMTMSPQVKHEAFKAVKAQFKKTVHIQTPGVVLLKVLPRVPSELKKQYPCLWNSVFKDDEPSALPAVSLLSVETLAQTVPMRTSSSLGRIAQTTESGFTVPTAHWQGMQQMMMMMQMMTGRAAPSPQPPVLVRAKSRLTLCDGTSADSQSSSDGDRLPAVTQPSMPKAIANEPLVEEKNGQNRIETTGSGASPLPPSETSSDIRQVTAALVTALNKAEDTKKQKRDASSATPNKAAASAPKRKAVAHKKAAAKAATKKKKKSLPSKSLLKPEKKVAIKIETKKAGAGKWTRQPPASLVQKYRDGCSKCRYAKGCTPSCWAKRGY